MPGHNLWQETRLPYGEAATVRGPLAAVAFDAGRAPQALRLLYADLDLAERPTLRRALALAPHEATDDEALALAAYARWGPEAAAHLGGQFAFAVWDPDRRAVAAVRDPVGLRPLFYAPRGETIVIGGDLRTILRAGGLDGALDDDVMAAVLLHHAFHPSQVGRTCLKGVDELRGGHWLLFKENVVQTRRYWRPEETPVQPYRSVEEAGEALCAVLREVLAEAVADVAPGTLGGHLSPGLDASTVLSFAAEACAAAGAPPPHAFTWSPPPDPEAARVPEYLRMASVVQRWELPFTYTSPDPEDLFAGSLLDAAMDPVTMWKPEQPVRRAASEAGFRVLLSGWGGDEAASFSGRSLVSEHLFRTGQWGPLAAMIVRDPLDAARRLRGHLRHRNTSAGFSLEALRTAALKGEHQTFAHRSLIERAHLPEPVPPPLDDPRAYAAWLLSRGHVGDRAGAWARAGAPFGLHYRYPLLDRRVLAVALGVPARLWLTRERRRRWILRAAGAGVVPDPIRLGPKEEPLSLDARRRASGGSLERLAPLVTPEAAGDRARFIDVPRLRTTLDALAGAGPPEKGSSNRKRTGGLHAIQYLALGTRPPASSPRMAT